MVGLPPARLAASLAAPDPACSFSAPYSSVVLATAGQGDSLIQTPVDADGRRKISGGKLRDVSRLCAFIGLEPVPLTGLATNFSPMPRRPPLPSTREIDGTRKGSLPSPAPSSRTRLDSSILHFCVAPLTKRRVTATPIRRIKRRLGVETPSGHLNESTQHRATSVTFFTRST